jgi:hypothetical protein
MALTCLARTNSSALRPAGALGYALCRIRSLDMALAPHRSCMNKRTRTPFWEVALGEQSFPAFLAGRNGWSSTRINTYLHMLEKLCAYRRFFIADNGCIGLAPLEAKEGDMICVLFGAEVPCILRGKDGRAEYVGDTYFHSYMDSEAIDNTSNHPVFFMM